MYFQKEEAKKYFKVINAKKLERQGPKKISKVPDWKKKFSSNRNILFIKVNGKEVLKTDYSENRRRGISVLSLRKTVTGGCRVVHNSSKQFDTHEDQSAAALFVNHINLQPAGTIIVAITSDSFAIGKNVIPLKKLANLL